MKLILTLLFSVFLLQLQLTQGLQTTPDAVLDKLKASISSILEEKEDLSTIKTINFLLDQLNEQIQEDEELQEEGQFYLSGQIDYAETDERTEQKEELPQTKSFFSKNNNNDEKENPLFNSVKGKKKPSLICRTCENIFSHIYTKNTTRLATVIQNFVIFICEKLHLTASPVCQGAVQEFAPIIIQQLQQRFFNPLRACPLLKLCRKHYQRVDIDQVVKNILQRPIQSQNGQKEHQQQDQQQQQQTPRPTLRKTYKLLHVTDIHMDFWYIPFSNANCEFPLCCRNQTAQPQQTLFDKQKSQSKDSKINNKNNQDNDFEAAGFWGTLGKCDLPQHTLQQFVQFLQQQQNNSASNPNPDPVLQNIDLAFWSGDTAAHNIWNQGVQSNINHTLIATEMFKQLPFNFAPIMGNHECFPVNMYEFGSSREDPLKSSFSEAWLDWVGPDAAAQIRKESFYTYFAKEIGARVVGFTTESCNPINFFLLPDATDPGNELQWLYDVLLQAEANAEKVFLVAHIPVNECLQKWARVYDAIIERFNNTVRAQFVGHTHHDHFLVVQSQDTKRNGTQEQHTKGSGEQHTKGNPNPTNSNPNPIKSNPNPSNPNPTKSNPNPTNPNPNPINPNPTIPNPTNPNPNPTNPNPTKSNPNPTEKKQREPVSVQFIAPSMTTEGAVNPSFRVYEVDADTLLPLNYYQYRLNLTYWNSQYPDVKNIKWDLAYNFLEEYGMDNMYEASQWEMLAERIKSDKKTYDKFVYNYYTGNTKAYNPDAKEIDKAFYCNTKGLPSQVAWCNKKYNPSFLLGAVEGHWIEPKKQE